MSMPTLVEAAQAADAAVKTATPEEEAAVAAVTVGQATEEDEQRGVDDGVPVEHPGQLAEVRGPEVPGDLGQGHVDDEQVEAGQDHPGADDDQHLPGAGSSPGRPSGRDPAAAEWIPSQNSL